jgi:hypothetical protein
MYEYLNGLFPYDINDLSQFPKLFALHIFRLM